MPHTKGPARLAIRLGGLGLFAGLLTGCFNQFEEYQQTTPPSRPPGAEALRPGPAPEVFPLVPGARFDYTARFGLGAGMFSGSATISVLDAWREGERERASVRVVSRYFGQTRREPYIFAREAGWIGLFEKYPPDKITFFMPTQLQDGQTWQVETGEGTGTARVEAIEPVSVPAATFAGCYRVRYINPGAKTDMTLWMAPRVGLVKALVAMTVSVLPLQGTLELTRYHAPLGPLDASSSLPARPARAARSPG